MINIKKKIISSAIVETEIEKKKPTELRSAELDQALKKPKTTVVELRAFERGWLSYCAYSVTVTASTSVTTMTIDIPSGAQEKASSFKDDEVQKAFSDINTRHAQMLRSDASRELKSHEPNVNIESELHVIRARAMLELRDQDVSSQDFSSKIVQKTQPTKKEPPVFTKPLQNVTVKEGHPVR